MRNDASIYDHCSTMAVIYHIRYSMRKTYLRACAPSEDSDQPAHSDKNLHWRILDSQVFLNADIEIFYQTVRMRKLILVFIGRTC